MEEQKIQNSHNNLELFDLHISCRGLKNLNNAFISDSQVSVYRNLGHTHDLELIGKTEVAKHNVNPDFSTTIRVGYDFSRVQKLVFQVFDANNSIIGKLTELAIKGETKDSWMGCAKAKLSQLIGAKDSVSKIIIYKDEQFAGYMIVYAERVRDGGAQITTMNWQWFGQNLKDVEWFSKSDPFAKFYRVDNEESKFLIYQTEVIDNNLNPQWRSWKTTKEELCPKNDKFFVEVWDYNRVGGHKLIASTYVSIDAILTHRHREFTLLTKKNKSAGKLQIKSIDIFKPSEVIKEITFLDYLQGDWQLSFLAGIDFTFSNGPINRPDSLHEIRTDKLNQYQSTLKYLGGVIVSYDFDKKVNLYGFGGVPKLPNYSKPYAEDCFPLNGNKDDPSCQDVSGILGTYACAVPHIEFSGPTLIANVLKNARLQAQKNSTNHIYTIVLIITDGQIEDMEDAFKEIVLASLLPISIIIVGVGDDDFSYMHKLDDINQVKKRASSDLVDKVRDITQFVAVKDFQFDCEALCQKVLNVFPRQFMEYMKIQNIQPKQQQKVNLQNINI